MIVRIIGFLFSLAFCARNQQAETFQERIPVVRKKPVVLSNGKFPTVLFFHLVEKAKYQDKFLQLEHFSAVLPFVDQLASHIDLLKEISTAEISKNNGIKALSLALLRVLRGADDPKYDLLGQLRWLEFYSYEMFKRLMANNALKESELNQSLPPILADALKIIFPALEVYDEITKSYFLPNWFFFVNVVNQTAYFSPLNFYDYFYRMDQPKTNTNWMKKVIPEPGKDSSSGLGLFVALNDDVLNVIIRHAFSKNGRFSDLRTLSRSFYHLKPLVRMSKIVPEEEFIEYLMVLHHRRETLAKKLVERTGVFADIPEHVWHKALHGYAFIAPGELNWSYALIMFPFDIAAENITLFATFLAKHPKERVHMSINALKCILHFAIASGDRRWYIHKNLRSINKVLTLISTTLPDLSEAGHLKEVVSLFFEKTTSSFLTCAMGICKAEQGHPQICVEKLYKLIAREGIYF